MKPKVLIFDWDDTICPTTFLDRCNVDNISQLPEQQRQLFDEICRLTERCLLEASKFGEVIIITNSDEGWVDYSCKKYFPQLLPVIENYKVVSARTGYEKFYPRQPLCWKAAAFAHEVNECFGNADIDMDASCESMESTDVSSDEDSNAAPISNNRKDIISFGDSNEERTAVQIVSNQLQATSKSVMFVSAPTPVQIIGQLQLVTHYMRYVCEHQSSIDLEINAEQAESCAEKHLRRQRRFHDYLYSSEMESNDL